MPTQRLARITGIFYLANIAIGIVGLMWQQQGRTGPANAMIIAGAVEYAIVVLLLGRLFEPAGRARSWLAAAIGVVACALSATVPLGMWTPDFNIVAVFGPYCIALGAVIVASGMMPRLIGWLLVVGGTSWLTFFLPALSHRIAPWNTAVGAVPEVLLTLWLIVFGVHAAAKKEGSTRDALPSES